jgi:hypothetical protein
MELETFMNHLLRNAAATTGLLVGLSGCASTSAPGDNVIAGHRSRECKAVAVNSASEQIRSQVRGTASADDIDRAQGKAGLGRAKVNTPPVLRSSPGTGLLNDAVNDC